MGSITAPTASTWHAVYGGFGPLAACLPTSMRIKAAQLTQLLAGESERVVACHDYVRSLRLEVGGHFARGTAYAMGARAGTALDKCDLLIKSYSNAAAFRHASGCTPFTPTSFEVCEMWSSRRCCIPCSRRG